MNLAGRVIASRYLLRSSDQPFDGEQIVIGEKITFSVS